MDRSLLDRAALAEGLSEMGYKLTTEEVDNLLDQLDPGNTGHVAKSQLAASQIDWKALQENQTERWLRCARRAFADLDSDKDGLVSTEDMVALLRHKLPPAEVELAVRKALVEASRRRDNDSSHGGSAGSPGASAHGGSQTGGVVGGGSSHDGQAAVQGHSMVASASDPSLRNGLNFRQFMRMLHPGSCDSLDLYEDRLGSLGSPEKSGFLAMGTTPTGVERVNMLLDRSIKGGTGYARGAVLDPVPENDGDL